MGRKALTTQQRLAAEPKKLISLNLSSKTILRLDAIAKLEGCTRTDIINAFGSGDFCTKSCEICQNNNEEFPYKNIDVHRVLEL